MLPRKSIAMPNRLSRSSVLLQNGLERFASVDEPVRVQHRHAALKLGCSVGSQEVEETDFPEVLSVCA